MRQWGVQTRKFQGSTLLAMAGAMALVVGTMACGGGGSSSSGPSSSTSISGLSTDGAVKGGTVKVFSGDAATTCMTDTTTGQDGTYNLTVGSGCTFPLRIEVSGGIDATTNLNNDLTMTSFVTGPTQTTANVSPLTTLMTAALLEAAGGSFDKLDDLPNTAIDAMVKSVGTSALAAFGFGADTGSGAGFNPLSTALTSTAQKEAYTKAADVLGETLRKIATQMKSNANPNDVKELAKKLGKNLGGGNESLTLGNTTLTGTELNALTEVNKAISTAQMLSGNFPRSYLNATGGQTMTNATVNTLSQISTLSSSLKQQMAMSAKIAALMTNIPGLSTLATQMANIANSGGAAQGISITGLATTITSGQLGQIKTDANRLTNATSLIVQPVIRVFDYPQGTLNSRTTQTLAQTVADNAMTANVPNALNANNLRNVANGGGMPPTIDFDLDNLGNTPASGTVVVTASLFDRRTGTNFTNAACDAGERCITGSTTLNWTRTGNRIYLEAPANGTASVTYRTASATTWGTATLTNNDADFMVVTAADGALVPATMKFKVARLFALMDQYGMSPTGTTGQYFYQVDISGLNFAGCNSTQTGQCNPSNAKKFVTVQGTLSAQ
ncbi:MAG: hypothetical protein G8237_06755 [Magnetococcales bacterium]|nr:hypothetical protein [Magnetococcales bacterium]NGZ06040.1 hypothetical protein [Magnetococcales bacterium]